MSKDWESQKRTREKMLQALHLRAWDRGRNIVNKHQPIKQTGQSEEPLKKQEVAHKYPPKTVEYGGPKGPEPTRYGDWEQAGRCTDF